MITINDFLNNPNGYGANDLCDAIRKGEMDLDVLKETGLLDREKRAEIVKCLNQSKEEKKDFDDIKTVSACDNFLNAYPDSIFKDDVVKLKAGLMKEIEKLEFSKCFTVKDYEEFLLKYPNGHFMNDVKLILEQMRSSVISSILSNPNDFTPDEVVKNLSASDLNNICDELGISVDFVKNHNTPKVHFSPNIPVSKSDVPSDFTDIFFWGIPSSGKTCALAAIFHTLDKDYTISVDSSCGGFGTNYRDSLINIFDKKGFGNLPARTVPDKTQYMPMLIKKRGEKHKYRKISFFELSGEVFKNFREIVTKDVTIASKGSIEETFKSLDIVLGSSNKKIHFFFIDYVKESSQSVVDSEGFTQKQYLQSAADYFNIREDIFKKNTKKIYIIVSKADQIQAVDRTVAAGDFLKENFGGFMDSIDTICNKYDIEPQIKVFSIGDVYFKSLCSINTHDSRGIIDSLIKSVKPTSDNALIKFFYNFFSN